MADVRCFSSPYLQHQRQTDARIAATQVARDQEVADEAMDRCRRGRMVPT